MTVEPADSHLRRVLGPVEVTASGVGIIIGAGIYVLLAPATARAGAAVWVSFAVAAFLCGLTGLSYAELAAMYPRSSAEYDYTRRVLPEPVAFVVGWMMVAGLSVAAAVIAVGFARHLQYFVSVPVSATAVALLIAEGLFARRGISMSARLTVVLASIQVAALLVLIAIGAPHLGNVDLTPRAPTGDVLGAAALVFFAFIGFDEVITLSEETRSPSRVIPRALLTALAISTALYVGVAVTAISVLGPSALGASSRPLVDVASHVLGGRAETAVAVVAIVTTINTSLLALTAASRLLYGMADEGALPPSIGHVDDRSGAPTTAIAIATVVAAAFAGIGHLTVVASVTDFSVYVVFLAVNVAVVLLRRRQPDVDRPFRVPGAIGRVPLIPVAGFLATCVMIPRLSGAAVVVGCGLLAAGVAVERLRPVRPGRS